MKRGLLSKASALLLSFAMVTTLIQPIGTEALTQDKVIKVFHTNDTHSRVDSFSDAKYYMDSVVPADKRILLDAGDTYHGQSFATLEKGSSIAKLLKAMDYKAMVPGNHDFNYGQDRLHELEQESGVPVLASNIKKDGNPAFNSSTTVIIDGVKFGIFGVATPETAYKTNPTNVIGLDFGTKESIMKESQEIVDSLKADGADVIIALSHLGIDDDAEIKATDLGATVKGIDLIIDGHSHSALEKYAQFNEAHDTTITSSNDYLKTLGEVTITLDSNNDVKNIDVKNVVLRKGDKGEIPIFGQDPAIKNLIQTIKDAQKPILEQVVGNSPIALDGHRNSVRFGHSNLGRVLTSAMLHETGADISLTNGGGIRDSINVGDITKDEVIKVLPFGNYIITKYLTGAEIIQALEHGMIIGSASFSHYAGMTVDTIVYTDEKGNARHKVTNVLIGNELIDLEKQYLVATNDFMGVGGDGFTMFKGKPVVNEFSGLDEAFIKYVNKVGEAGIIADDTDVRLFDKKSFTVEEATFLLSLFITAEVPVEIEATKDPKNVFLVFTDETGAKVRLTVTDTTVEEMNAIIKEIKDSLTPPTIPPTEPEVPPTKPEVPPTTPGTTPPVTDKPATLPQTGGTNPNHLVILGGLMIMAGIVFLKKQKTA